MTPTALVLGSFGVVGISAAAVLAPPRVSWRSAAEHSRIFWLTWIVGFAALGFLGPATAGLGWAPTAWLALWSAIGALQPSLVADLVEVRRFTRRHLIPEPIPGGGAVPSEAVRWRAPTTLPAGTDPVLTRH